MSLSVLIVPDKFKGTLTARAAATAIAEGWSRARPTDRIKTLPMADGGDGFGEVIGGLLNAAQRTCRTVDAAGQPRDALWWQAGSKAVLESAEVNGLALLAAGKHHPFALDSFGLAAVLQEASSAGVGEFYVGLGGSATNDAGFGLAKALGWRFCDAQGLELHAWTRLDELATITAPAHRLGFAQLTVAVDVTNPLLGPQGATEVYGPQKGLTTAADRTKAEACLRRLAQIVERTLGIPFAGEAGAGAAGGLGFGLRAFCNGVMRAGGEIFAEHADLHTHVSNADIVITAEGALDAQSLMGKGVGLVAEVAASADKLCLCLAGAASIEPQPRWPNFRAYAIVPTLTDLQHSKANPAYWLSELAVLAAKDQ